MRTHSACIPTAILATLLASCGGESTADVGASLAGYTLVSPLESTTTLLVDMDGEPVHSWETERPPCGTGYLLEDGRLVLATEELGNPTFVGGGSGGRVREYSWEGELLWQFDYNDAEHLQHHDLSVLPNGNLLLIAWEHKSREEALAAGRDPERVGERGLWPDQIVEVEPIRPEGGRIVWEWHAWDHIVQERDPSLPNYGRVADHPELLDLNARSGWDEPEVEEERLQAMEDLGYFGGGDDDEEEIEHEAEEYDASWPRHADWMHTNAVDYEPELDLIVLSSPEFNEVFVIDHSTTTEEAAGHTGGRFGRGGDLLYRWGNPASYGAGDASDRQLFFQHDSSWIAPGRILVFNNGGGRPDGSYSSVLELELPLDSAGGIHCEEGEPFGPERPSWIHVAPEPESFFSSFISGAQRLANGNTLICEGEKGFVFEVTRSGERVWEFQNTRGGEVPIPHPWDPPAEETAEAEEASGAGGGSEGEGDDDHDDEDDDYMDPYALFRATRIPLDHPALRGRGL